MGFETTLERGLSPSLSPPVRHDGQGAGPQQCRPWSRPGPRPPRWARRLHNTNCRSKSCFYFIIENLTANISFLRELLHKCDTFSICLLRRVRHWIFCFFWCRYDSKIFGFRNLIIDSPIVSPSQKSVNQQSGNIMKISGLTVVVRYSKTVWFPSTAKTPKTADCQTR